MNLFFGLPGWLTSGAGGGGGPVDPSEGHRYWRLRLDAGGVFGDVQALAAVELRDAVGGSNIASSATVTASSTLSSNVASNVLDGDPETFWASSQANDGWNEWLTFDFGGNVVVEEVALTARNTGSDFHQSTLTGALEFSDDGSTWDLAFLFGAVTTYTSGSTKVFSAPPAPDDAPHRYWEVLTVRATTNGIAVTSSNTAIAELAFREITGGSNTLSGGTASASDASFGAAANAIDDNGSTFWATVNPSMMQWWRYDYGVGNSANIREVAVTARNDASSHQAPGQIVLRYSDDGSSWVTKFISEVLPTAYTAGQTKVFTDPVLDWFTITAPMFAVGEFSAWTNVVSRQIISPAKALRPQEGNAGLRLTLRGKVGGGDTTVNAVRVSAVPKTQPHFDVGPDGWTTVEFSASESVIVPQNDFVMSDTFGVPGLGAAGKEALLVSMALNTWAPSAAEAIQGWRGSRLNSSSDAESTDTFLPIGTTQVLHSIEGFGQEPEPHVEVQYVWGDATGYNPASNSNNSWNDVTIRHLLKQSAIGAPLGKWVRFRFSGSAATNSIYFNTINRAAVSTVPTAQTNWDVGPNGWVPLTFGDGAAFGLAPLRDVAWSDPVFLPDYGDVGHEAIVVSFHVQGDSQPRRGTGLTGWTTGFRRYGDHVESTETFSSMSDPVTLTAVQTGLVGAEGEANAANVRRYVVMEFEGALANTLRRYVVMEDL